MPITGAEDFLPKSKSMLDAYARINNRYKRLGDTIEKLSNAPEKLLHQASGDYLTAGIGYLANRGHNAFIMEIGTITWLMVNQQKVLPALTNDMAGAMEVLGVPHEVAKEQGKENNEPFVLASPTIAYILIPNAFILRQRNSPIEALATTAWFCSYVRDFAHGKIFTDMANIEPRQSAAQAEFLLEAKRLYPDFELSIPYSERLKRYPDGIASLHAYQMY
jgi:hypothetical protein